MQNKNKLIIYVVVILNLLLLALTVTAQTIPFASTQEDLPQKKLPLEAIPQQDTMPTGTFANLIQKDSLQKEKSPFDNLIESSKTEPKFNLNWLYIAAPIFLTIGFLVYLEADRKKGHRELMSQKKQHNIIALRSYAVTNLRKGFTREQIRNALIKNNYSNEEIEKAFRGLM